jgi:hypothetical protein
MKTRIIELGFWSDEIVEQESKNAKLLHIFLFTNELIGHCGIYKISDKTMCFRTGLSPTELKGAQTELQGLKRAFFYNGWVLVEHAQRLSYRKGIWNEKASNRELDTIPKDISTTFKQLSASYPQYYQHPPKNEKDSPKANN